MPPGETWTRCSGGVLLLWASLSWSPHTAGTVLYVFNSFTFVQLLKWCVSRICHGCDNMNSGGSVWFNQPSVEITLHQLCPRNKNGLGALKTKQNTRLLGWLMWIETFDKMEYVFCETGEWWTEHFLHGLAPIRAFVVFCGELKLTQPLADHNPKAQFVSTF